MSGAEPKTDIAPIWRDSLHRMILRILFFLWFESFVVNSGPLDVPSILNMLPKASANQFLAREDEAVGKLGRSLALPHYHSWA
jgi:hypothetical protein